MADTSLIAVEIAYGTAEAQFLETVYVPQGCTAREAVGRSTLFHAFPDADPAAPLGIFGKAVKDSAVLQAGDRVEVYRPLLIDPKTARRRRVAKQQDAV